MGLRIILTGATGMVGEGVLMECLQNLSVSKVLVVTRKPVDMTHEKLSQLTVADFTNLGDHKSSLAEFDACFYCAGISSNGMTEADYTKITFDTTIQFAKVLKDANADLVFNFISGAHADSSEKGRAMWARVKGKTENALIGLYPGRQYSFRPGLMKPFPGQIQIRGYNRWTVRLMPLLGLIFRPCTLSTLGRAMIATARDGYSKPVLEVEDILVVGG